MVEAHFYSQGELIATARHEAGETMFGGPDPEKARRITAEITVLGANGPVRFQDAPEFWLQHIPGELRSPYASAIVVADDASHHPRRTDLASVAPDS
jgi:hypothetical protein